MVSEQSLNRVEMIKSLRDKYDLSLKDCVDITKSTNNDYFLSCLIAEHMVAERDSKKEPEVLNTTEAPYSPFIF